MDKISIIRNIINKVITKDDIFSNFLAEIEALTLSPSHTILELRAQNCNKKQKGDLWEAFCCLYLQHVLEHDNVWFIKNLPSNLINKFNLPKTDFGIDLISEKDGKYYAIQCKYKKSKEQIQLVSWRSLATFFAIVEKTGPWEKHIVMTNINGCKHIGKKGEKDLSLCIGTFKKMDRFQWIKMLEKPTLLEQKQDIDKEELRRKRLAFYDKKINE